VKEIYFFTAVIFNKEKVFFDKHCCEIIVSSFRYMVENNRLFIYAFVVMPDHIHLIWQTADEWEYKSNQRDFMKFTAQKIKFHLGDTGSLKLVKLRVGKSDREYQIWQRNPLSIELYNDQIIEQKITYIHNNPVQKGWMLSDSPEEYYYSSASFYMNGDNRWSFLTNIYEV